MRFSTSFSALIVSPKAPYVAWATEHNSGITVTSETFSEDPPVWIIPDTESFTTDAEREAYLGGLKVDLFKRMLSDWDPDESTWPKKKITAKLFDEWFDIKLHKLARFIDDVAIDNIFYDELVAEEDGFEGEEKVIDSDSDDASAHRMIIEAIDQQLRVGEPPQAKQTFKRLISEGIDAREAKRLLATVLVSEIFSAGKSGKPFNESRYVSKLSVLPTTPFPRT